MTPPPAGVAKSPQRVIPRRRVDGIADRAGKKGPPYRGARDFLAHTARQRRGMRQAAARHHEGAKLPSLARTAFKKTRLDIAEQSMLLKMEIQFARPTDMSEIGRSETAYFF